MSAATDALWKLTLLDRQVRVAEIRAIEKMIEEEIEQARQEGWSDGYFEAGGLQ